MTAFPSLFVSHGAPMLVRHPGPAYYFLKQLGIDLRIPKAILCITAHWETEFPIVSASSIGKLFHSGQFPNEVMKLDYSTVGHPALAARVADIISSAGLLCETDSSRGLDRGTWIPLMLMYPNANIPVVQLSVQPQQEPSFHFNLGRLLAPLRSEGVLILGSGSATHNLMKMTSDPNDDAVPAWVRMFDHWLLAGVLDHRLEELFNYRKIAPYAELNHPTPEHLLPLFVALGAGESAAAKAKLIHHSYTYGVFSMAAFAFE